MITTTGWWWSEEQPYNANFDLDVFGPAAINLLFVFIFFIIPLGMILLSAAMKNANNRR
jgi:hypothetical protein